MNIMLKQLDITLNQCYSPYFDNLFDKYNPLYINSLYDKIKTRFDQIDNLKRLLNEELNDYDFYFLAEKAYNFRYPNHTFIKTNILIPSYHDYLMINIRVSSNFDIDYNKSYSLEEILDMFKNKEILFENIFISEDNDIKDTSDFVICNNEEFSKYYNTVKDLNSIISNCNINIVKQTLTKGRLKKDLEELIKFTESELGYLSKKYGDEYMMLL